MNTKQKNFKEATKSLFLKYTVIPILMLFVLFFVFTLFIFKMKVIHDGNRAAEKIMEQAEAIYQTYSGEVERMSESSEVIQYVDTRQNSHLVYEEFYKFNNQQQVKSAFNIVDTNGIFLSSSAISNLEASEDILENIIPLINKNDGKLLIDSHTTKYSHERMTVLTFAKAIKKHDRVIGYLIYQLYEDDILNVIFGKNADITVITDKYNHIIVTTNSIVKGMMNKFNPERVDDSYVKIKNDTYYMSELQESKNQFKVFVLKATQYNHTVLWLYIAFVILTGTILYFLVKQLAERMSSKNVHSIEKLLAAVSSLQGGNMKAYVTIDTGDEFEILANQYNAMLDTLNELVKKNKELSDVRRMDEIKFLQSQFNPHFLFNVLETLRYTMLSDKEQAQEIIITLSRLLRYSISTKDKDVLFKNDLDYILDYLKLHKFRFNERLSYQVDVPVEIQKTQVPKLLLQPIIENAIKYGYRDQTHLNISITGVVTDNVMTLRVTDDGSGIEEKELDAITKRLQQANSKNEHIGLYNAHRKLVLLYGEEYGLTISSVFGVGTSVEMTLPYGKRGL